MSPSPLLPLLLAAATRNTPTTLSSLFSYGLLRQGIKLTTTTYSNGYDNDATPNSGNSIGGCNEYKYDNLVLPWPSAHLRALPPSDLMYYASALVANGFDTLKKLNSMNHADGGGDCDYYHHTRDNGGGGGDNDEKHGNMRRRGRVEDLYFMNKAHRRVLMKKIRIMRFAACRGVSASTRREGGGHRFCAVAVVVVIISSGGGCGQWHGH